MRSLRYVDSDGLDGTCSLEVTAGRVYLTDVDADFLSFDLRELRAELEVEAVEYGPVSPAAPGAGEGRRAL